MIKHDGKIACIGFRNAPKEAVSFMEFIGRTLVTYGYSKATGNAVGSDQA